MTALLLLRKSRSAESSVTCAPCLDATGRRLSIQAVSKYVVGPRSRSVSFTRLLFSTERLFQRLLIVAAEPVSD